MTPSKFAGLRSPSRLAETPYQLLCACGGTLQGQRKADAQTLRCPACGRVRFVLPRSALPAVTDSPPSLTVGPTAPGPRHAFWISGAAISLVVLLAASLAVAVIHSLRPDKAPDGETRLSPGERFDRHWLAGQDAMKSGDYHIAAKELTAAIDLARELPNRLRLEELRAATQQRRQAALAADLLSESLSEVIHNSIGVADPEWQEIFTKRYAGRSFIMDDTIHRDAAGQIHHGYRFRIAGRDGRLDLASLTAVEHLPIPVPTRVLIGMRLAGFRLEKDVWIIDPEPKSGVLITDVRLVTNLSLRLDAETEAVLKRQEHWLPLAD
jgi:hypothetical protein